MFKELAYYDGVYGGTTYVGGESISGVNKNEAAGLPETIDNENNVRIEQSDEVDSLNLTTSIAIALYRLRMDRGY